MTNKTIKPLLLAAGALAVVASPAHAVLRISAQVDGLPFFTCEDQTACDTDPAPGSLRVGDRTVAVAGGTVRIIGSSQLQTIGIANDALNTSSFQIINNTLENMPITIAVGGTDFVGPVTHFFASGSGTAQNATGSEITLQFFGDPANQQGASNPFDTPPGVPLADSGVITATSPSFSFSRNFAGPFDAAGPFSMTLWASGFLTPGGQLVGRSQSIIAEAPEPASLMLLGGALAGLGVFGRKRRRTKAAA